MSNLENFASEYFKAEARASSSGSKGKVFTSEDKQKLGIALNQMIMSGQVAGINEVASYLADEEDNRKAYSKHYNRIRFWLPFASTDKELVEEVSPKGQISVETSFRSNIAYNFKSTCRAALKNKLTQDVITTIMTNCLEEACIEILAEENVSKVENFLRTSNISKEVVLEILTNI